MQARWTGVVDNMKRFLPFVLRDNMNQNEQLQRAFEEHYKKLELNLDNFTTTDSVLK